MVPHFANTIPPLIVLYDMPTASTEHRLTSTVSRVEYDGVIAYRKRLRQDSWESDPDTLIARTQREADIIRQLAHIPASCSRFGRLELLDCSPADGIITTREVPGTPLAHWLHTRPLALRRGLALRPFYLSGAWLVDFQSLDTSKGATALIGDRSPLDLLDYCDIRIAAIRNAGYSWLTGCRRDRLLSVIGALQVRSDDSDLGLVWSHGDYAPHNIMWDGRTLTPIDFTMANLASPLVDVTYFIHRLEMLPIYFPWRRWPIATWTAAFLRGYGRPDAASSPMYTALMIRHLICRLLTYVKRPAPDFARRTHAKWVRLNIRRRLMALVDSSDPEIDR